MSGAAAAIAAALTVAVPLLAAPLSFLLGRRSAPLLPLAAGAATTAAALAAAWLVGEHGAATHALGGWAAPLGIAWRLDGLAALMLAATALLSLGVGVFAALHLPRQELYGEHARFWPPFLFLWGGLNAVFLSADLFNWYVALELVTLAAVVLVTLPGKGASLTAGMRYLLVSQAGSLVYLAGVGLVYAAFGTLHIGQLSQTVEPGAAAAAALALMTVGLFAKTAFLPLHAWLPPAHGAAPAPASALLSGLVVKASFFVLLRLWLEALGPAAADTARQLAGACGAAAVLWASLLALRQVRLKLLVAYSTIAQVGYLLLVLPLAGEAAALQGVVLLMLAHAFAKVAMFLAAGLILQALGHDRLDGIGGAARHMPMTVFAIGLAGLTLIGLPPSGGFTAKWLLLQAALAAGQWWWILVLVGGGLLAAAYVFIVMAGAFAAADEAEQAAFRPVVRPLEWLALAIAAVSVALGFLGEPLAGLVRA